MNERERSKRERPFFCLIAKRYYKVEKKNKIETQCIVRNKEIKPVPRETDVKKKISRGE